MEKKRVLVLFGGTSAEHPISIKTAKNVLDAMDRQKYEVYPVGITPHGQWVYIPDGHIDQAVETNSTGLETLKDSQNTAHILSSHTSEGTQASLYQGPAHPHQNHSLTLELISQIDVIFPVLHGPDGEDGTVQGLFETLGIDYVGCGVLASSVGMDKHFMKVVFDNAGLNVSPWVTVLQDQYDSEQLTAELQKMNWPLFVKPSRAGSSFGVTKIDDLSGLEAALDEAFKYDSKVVIEEGLQGQEVEVAVLDGGAGKPPRATMAGEILVEDSDHDNVYDFESKYLGQGDTTTNIPADLPPEIMKQIQAQALTAFKSLDGKGLSRADFFYTTEGDVYINEINTMPGFTEISMYPQLWESAGTSYSQLIDELISLAGQ